MTGSRYAEKVATHARQRLILKPGAKPAEILNLYKRFLKLEEHRLRMAHGAGSSGREVARGRAHVIETLLKNRLYLGEVPHCGEWHKGQHEAIIDAVAFDRVQNIREDNRRGAKAPREKIGRAHV